MKNNCCIWKNINGSFASKVVEVGAALSPEKGTTQLDVFVVVNRITRSRSMRITQIGVHTNLVILGELNIASAVKEFLES